MKYAVLLLLLIAPCTLLAQSKQDYPITIHITASYIGESCDVGTSCKPKQILDVVIAGKKYELQSLTYFPKGVVPLGDYPAKLHENRVKPTGEFWRSYDLMFPNGSTRIFKVIGVME